jgi:hypothetical protein
MLTFSAGDLMTIQTQKAFYEKKLLAGLMKNYKAKQPIIGPRISLSSGKGQNVIKNCKGLCQVCGEKYVDNPHGFVIHHVDGNRTNDNDKNLVLMTATYHSAIHGEVNVVFNEYKKTHPIIPRPKSKPKPKMSAKSVYGEVDVMERWRIAEQQTQDKWKKAVNATLNNLGFDF